MLFLVDGTLSEKGDFLKSREKEETRVNVFSLGTDLKVWLTG